MRNKNKAVLILTLAALVGCAEEDVTAYSESTASYEEANSEVGCESKYSDDKKDDIFESKYKNKWMTWGGEIVLAEAGEVSLNLDGGGIQDLAVDFANETDGYDLNIDDYLLVKFVMKRPGGCFLPFSGSHAIIVE